MGRPWRIEYPGALYHVLSRGNERRDIFFDPGDRFMFLNALGEMSERFDVQVFAYVLMPNHYHLLLKTRQANLSQSMQWLGVTYANRFNTRHHRSGHLFQGRYKSFLVQNESYLMQLSCYIHRNPLRAGIVKRLADYRWSSYLGYAYGRRVPAWLSMDAILKMFSAKNRHRAYREKVQDYANEEKRLWENFRHGLFLGSADFVGQMRKTHTPPRPERDIPQQKAVAEDQDIGRVLQRASDFLGCDLEKYRNSARISLSDRDDRDLLVYFVWQTGRVSNERLGRFFGLTYSSISHIIKRFKPRLEKDGRLKEKISALYSQLKTPRSPASGIFA